MILVDTSIWINLFSKSPRFILSDNDIDLCLTAPPILQEVLQEIKDNAIFQKTKESFLSLKRIGDPLTIDHYIHAAEIYRFGRKKGFTFIRSNAPTLAIPFL